MVRFTVVDIIKDFYHHVYARYGNYICLEDN